MRVRHRSLGIVKGSRIVSQVWLITGASRGISRALTEAVNS